MRIFLIFICILGFTFNAVSEDFLLGPPEQEGPVLVQAHFELNTLNKIDDEENTFEFSGVLTLKWIDPRISFNPTVEGVNEKFYQGTYQFNEIATGWYPQIYLVNESGYFEISGITLRILPDGSSTLIQTISAKAEVNLDLRKFPFDSQHLEGVFELVGFDDHEVLLQVDKNIIYQSNILFPLPQWDIGRINTSTANASLIVSIEAEHY